MSWQSKFFSNVFTIWNLWQSWTNLPRRSYRTGWACHWSQSLWVKDNWLKCIWTHLLSSRRRERNICVYGWNLTHPPGCTCVCFSLFQGPISEAIQLEPNQRQFLEEGAFYVVVQVYTWWVGGPEVGVVSWTLQSAPQLPLTFLLLQLRAHSPQVLTVTRVQSVTRGDTCKQTGLTRLIQGGLNTHLSKRQKAVSCLQLELSGLTLQRKEHSDWPECTRRGWGGWVFGSPFLWSGT